jgi:ABC-type uncharacterized transport system permease subunit
VNKNSAKNLMLTSALIVAGIRMWMQVRGKTKTPFSEWVIGFGATFFALSLLSEVSPAGAGSLSLLVAVSDFLINGVSLTTDLSGLVTGAVKGNILVAQPFAPSAAPAPASTTPSKAASFSVPGVSSLSATPPPGVTLTP